MRLPKLFLACMAIAILVAASNADGAPMLQSLVTNGPNTIFDHDWEHYTPGPTNTSGTIMAGDTITTFINFDSITNANGTTVFTDAFGTKYQFTAVATATITSVTDQQGSGASQVGDVAATISTSVYENPNDTGFKFNPNRLPGETDAQLLTRLNTEATSGNLVLTLLTNQALSEDVLINAAALFTTTTSQLTNFGDKVLTNAGIGIVPNGVTSTATDADEAGGPVNFTVVTDIAGTTKSFGNVSTNNNSALQIQTNTSLTFQGIATPEPGSMLIWAGLALAGGVYQRRRRGSLGYAAS